MVRIAQSLPLGNDSNNVQAGKGSKMQNLIDYRVRITMNDGRQLTGLLLAFDKFMNVVLADTEEFRRIKRRVTTKAQTDAVEQEEKRTLGLVILRGEQVVSLSVDAPPASEGVGRMAPINSGPGLSRPAGRGIPIANVAAMPPAGLAGPVRGVGGSMPPGFGRGFQGPPAGGAPPGMGAPLGGPPPGMPPQGFAPPGMFTSNLPLTRPGFAPPPPPGFRPPQ
jgi:small nuclear ribonucleoprotein B and B'